MSEEFVPEVQESMPQEAAAAEPAEAVAVKPAEEIPEAEVFMDDDSKNAIEAAKRSTSAEAKAKRKQAAAHVAERVSREKDEVPSTFFRRSKEAKWYIVLFTGKSFRNARCGLFSLSLCLRAGAALGGLYSIS